MTTVRYTTVDGEVIAEKRNGVRRLYVPDPLGSTVALLDNTQTQVDTFSYWPYGEVRTSTGTTSPPFQFVGTPGYYTDGVGRIYVRARYLHTQKGRWLTPDQLRFSGVDVNLYRYVGNNPEVIWDPSGQVPVCAPPPPPPPPLPLPAPRNCADVGKAAGTPMWNCDDGGKGHSPHQTYCRNACNVPPPPFGYVFCCCSKDIIIVLCKNKSGSVKYGMS